MSPDPKKPYSKKKVAVKSSRIVPVQKETREEKAEKRYQCKLAILKLLVNSVILETVGAVRKGYEADPSIRSEMDSILYDNIEDALNKIDSTISLCEPYMRYIDTTNLERLIIDLEHMDVTLANTYAEDIWNIYAPALLSI